MTLIHAGQLGSDDFLYLFNVGVVGDA
jgi:hypothetical protein